MRSSKANAGAHTCSPHVTSLPLGVFQLRTQSQHVGNTQQTPGGGWLTDPGLFSTDKEGPGSLCPGWNCCSRVLGLVGDREGRGKGWGGALLQSTKPGEW